MTRGLDTYVGRKITRMETDSDGNWFIELEGGVRVINTDGRRTLPSFPSSGTNMVFSTVIMDENQTQMVFLDGMQSEYRAVFTPTQYQIYDGHTQGEAWSPQAGDDELSVVLPPDPSSDRVVDGPEAETE